jgi:colanic acid biosynthesis glycosyl transferase WcaI
VQLIEAGLLSRQDALRERGWETSDGPLRDAAILIIGVNYWPETTGIGPYTTGFAEHLSTAGASVTVVTSVPHYPAWKIASGYEKVGPDRETHNHITVRRVRPRIPGRMTVLSRAAFEATFALRARAAAATERSDAIISVIPSLAGAGLGGWMARRRRVPYGVIFQDLMGRSAEQSGMAGKGVGAMTAGVERRLARKADLVGVVATGFSSFLESAGVEPRRLRHLPNWCHIQPSRAERSSTRAELGWADDQTIVLHAGNMGAKQALENVVQTARVAASRHPSIHFVLMGDGSRRRALEELGSGAPNLHFLDPQPSDRFPDILAAADVLLVNERATVRDMSLPSKLTSYFAAGRPVVAAVRSDGTTAAEVRRAEAGVIVAPGDPVALVAAIAALGLDSNQAGAFGARGHAYATEYLGQAAAAERSVSFAADLLNRTA